MQTIWRTKCWWKSAKIWGISHCVFRRVIRIGCQHPRAWVGSHGLTGPQAPILKVLKMVNWWRMSWLCEIISVRGRWWIFLFDFKNVDVLNGFEIRRIDDVCSLKLTRWDWRFWINRLHCYKSDLSNALIAFRTGKIPIIIFAPAYCRWWRMPRILMQHRCFSVLLPAVNRSKSVIRWLGKFTSTFLVQKVPYKNRDEYQYLNGIIFALLLVISFVTNLEYCLDFRYMRMKCIPTYFEGYC